MTCRQFLAYVGIAVVMAATSGCENARTRAHDHAAVFAKLSVGDQHLVLRSQIRDGMSKEAVYIAWGEPDQKQTVGSGKEASERWRYHRQLTVKAPLGPGDQLSYGNSVFGMTVPLAANAGFGFGGVGNAGVLLYQPHLQIADATVKEAEFRDGKLVSQRAYQGAFTLPR